MFKKLVSDLPFSPSLISYLRDYDLRLKKELRLQKASLIILVLVFLIQLLVIVLPPKASTLGSQTQLIGGSGPLVNNLNLPQCSPKHTNQCIRYYLSVRDINSSNIDANSTTVSAGDNIVYTLSVTNESTYSIHNLIIRVNLSDALVYSNLVNSYGGTDKNSVITYSIVQLKPNQSESEIIMTKIKSPIPNNSISSKNKNYSHYAMVVTFGNTVTVYLPMNFNKFYEINVNNYLPSGSSTESLVILIILIAVDTYFILRANLIRKEIRIIRHNLSNTKKGI